MFIGEEAVYYTGGWDSGRDVEDEAEVGEEGMGGEVIVEQRQNPPTISVTLSLKAWKDILNIFKPT